MRPAKIFATVFCGGVLALQGYVVFSSMGYNNYHWPFVNYPMYSSSHRAGDTFSDVQLRVLPCDNPRDTLRLGENDLHLMPGRFTGLLYGSAGVRGTRARSEENAEVLLGRITTYQRRPVCRVQVWEKRYTIGPKGLEYPGQPWTVAREWELPAAAAPDPQAPKP